MSDKENEILLQVQLETNNTVTKLSDIKTNLDNVGKSVNSLSDFFKVLGGAVNVAISNFNTNTSSVENFVNAISKSNTNIKNNSNELQKNTTVLQQQNKTINENTQNNNANEKSYLSLRNIIWELHYAYKGLLEGTKLITGISFTEWSREFEKNMYNMQSIALESVENFNYLKNSIIQISKDNNYSGLVGLSDALYQAYSSGFKMADALDLVKEADRGALAGLANTKDVLEALVSVMHSYNMTTDQASKVNDIFLKTVQDGVITMPQLSRYIGQATTIAPELGIALEDVAGGFVAMTRQGLNAAESTTALNAVMNTFLKPSKQALDYAKELGINLSASAFEGKNFAEVIKDIAQKGDIDVMGKIFGNIRGLKGFFKLAKDDGDKFVQYIESIKNSTGSVDKAIQEQRKSFDQTVTQLKNTWEIFMQNIGESVQKFLTPMVQVITILLKTLNNLPQILKDIITGLVLAGSILSGLIISTFSFNQGMKALGFTISAQKIAIDALSASYLRLEASAILAKTGLGFLGGAMTGLLSVAAALSAYKIGEGIGTVVNLKDDLQGAKDRVKDYYDNQKNAQTRVDLYKNKTNLGISLTSEEKHDYAQSLIQADPRSKENKQLAIELSTEYNLTIANHEKIIAAKQKIDKETAEKNIEIRKKYDNEKAQGTFDSLVFEATHSEQEIKLNKKAKEYDDKINLLKEHAKLANNVSAEEAKKDLEQAKILEIAKQKELEKLRKEYAEKAQLLHKKEIDDKYSQLINKKQVEINDIQDNNPKLNKIEVLKLQNKKLLELETIYNNKAKELNFKEGLVDKSESLKQASDIRLKILKNDKEVLREKLSIKLQTDKLDNDKAIKAVERFASKNDLNKDTELNNLQLVDKQRIKIIDERLKNESSLTLEQVKILNSEKENLEQKHIDREDEKQKIRKQRIIDNVFYEIDQEKIKFNLLVEMGQQSNKAQLENDIDTNNKMISEYKKQISLLDEVKSADKINELKKKITPLEDSNTLDQFKLNKLAYEKQKELDDKNFSDKNKSLELFRNLQIYSEETLSQELIKINAEKVQALQEQEKTFIKTYGSNPINEDKQKELQTLKDSILDTNNFILLESKKLTESIYQEEKRKLDIQIGFLDNYSNAFSKFGESLKNTNNDVFSLISNSFNSLSENYTKAIGIFRQIEPIQKQITDNKARQNSIKPLLDDEISKYKQTGIPTTKLSNLVNENKKLESDNKTANQQANIVGVMSAVEQVTNMIGKGVEVYQKQDEATKKLSQTYKLFGKDSKEVALAQSEVLESGLEIIKALPGIGDILYKVTRQITDFFGATKSEKEKKDIKDIESATLSYAKTKLNATSNYHETKLQLLEIDKQAELKALNDMNLSQKAFDIKKAEILYKSNQKLLELNRDYYNQLNELRNENTLLEIESIKSDTNLKFKARLDYIKELDTIMKEYNLTYEQMINSSDAVVRQKQLNADAKWTQAKTSIDLNRAETSISIQKETEKAKINLQEDSLTKKYQLAFLEYQNEKDLALKDRANEKLDQQQYLATLNLIELKYQKTQQDIKKESDDKLRGINEKNYNEELKAFESLNKNKTDKLKSELQKQYDIINEYEQKKKDLLESREQDQALKVKRANQLSIDLANKKKSLTGAFYEQNSENFDIGNGLNTGNNTNRTRVQDQFDLGLITYQERNAQMQNLALEKQLYYQALLSKYQDPKKQAEINSKIQEASKEYYEYVFDKEQEKLDVEKQQAQKKISLYESELKDREKLEADYITSLDNKYKDSAGLYKTAFIDASRDWIAYARQETIQKLGIDTFNQLQKTGVNLANNKAEAQKFLGNVVNTPVNSNASIPNNNNASSANNGFVYSPFDVPKDVIIPIQVQTQDTSLTTAQKQKILSNIYAKEGFGANAYTQAERITNQELIAYATKYDIPMYESGGVPNKGMFLYNEGNYQEAIINTPQMKNMYDFVIKNTKPNSSNVSNNNSNINLNLVINAQSSDSKNLANQIQSEVNKSFKTLTNTLSYGKK